MARGGLGVRHAQYERQSKSTRYGLVAVRAGSSIAECLDKYRRWELGYRTGVLLRNSTIVTVQWDGDEEFTFYTEGDARYKVDTDLWRITPPTEQSIFSIMRGESKRQLSPALTSGRGESRIASMPREGASAMTEEEAMPKTASGKKAGKTHKVVDDGGPKAVPIDSDGLIEFYDRHQLIAALREANPEVKILKSMKDDMLKRMLRAELAKQHPDNPDDDEVSALDEDDEVDDLVLDEDDDELDDEVDEPAPAKKGKAKKAAASDLPERETYTAKQVATRIGTDSKSLRKFFRSPASTVEPVGQGGRYEFDKADLPKIQAEFDAWKAKKPVRGPGKTKADKPKGRQAPANATVVEADDEIDDIEEEPDEAELAALEDDDLDLSLDDDEEDD